MPRLRPLDGLAKPDIVFHASSLPADLEFEKLQRREPVYISPFSDAAGTPLARMWRAPQSGMYCFRFIEGFSFVIDPAGEAVWAQWSEPVTLEDISVFLLGHILAFVLRLRGHVCLHASAVAIEGRAVLFAGDPGMGKSSTAAAFAERGYPVLTDDVAAIRREPGDQIFVSPGVPRLCLCPDSAEFLYGPAAATRLPLVQPTADKRLLPLDVNPGKFQLESLPLGAIYLLAPRSADGDAPRLENVTGADRLLRLLYNGFMNLVLQGDQKAHEFRILGEIGRRAHIRQLVPAADFRRLGRLCDLVVEDVQESVSATAQP